MPTHGTSERSGDEGFTLIELMVVVLIIAILIAIAIPTFLGARERAQDRTAQANLRTALTGAKALFSDDGDYVGVDNVALALVEPSIDYVAAGVPSDGSNISVAVSGDGLAWAGANLSDTGTCFYIGDELVAGGGTSFGESTADPCTGTQALLSAVNGSW